jgi:hypothetical protein
MVKLDLIIAIAGIVSAAAAAIIVIPPAYQHFATLMTYNLTKRCKSVVLDTRIASPSSLQARNFGLED